MNTTDSAKGNLSVFQEKTPKEMLRVKDPISKSSEPWMSARFLGTEAKSWKIFKRTKT